MRSIVGFVVVLLVVPVFAQEVTRPGPEHDRLKEYDGTWETTTKVGGLEHRGTITYKMDLGGMWQVGTMESEAGGQKYFGRAMNTYDARKKKYVSVWFDSGSPIPLVSEGNYDEGQKAFLMTGEAPGPDGKPVVTRGVFRILDRDNLHFSLSVGDVKDPVVTITYKRKK